MSDEVFAKAYDNLFNRPKYDPGFEYEDRFYIADPKTDVLLFDGSRLKDGMMVLIGEPTVRGKTPLDRRAGVDDFNRWFYQVKVFNRWCYVSDLKIDDLRVMFVGTYEDGTQVKHDHDINHAWIVRKSSMIRHSLKALEDMGVITHEEFVKIAREELNIDLRPMSRDERVRAYHTLPESERATWAVIADPRGDIIALEPDAVVANDSPDGRPHIYTARALRDLGWDNVAAVVMGSDNETRRKVVGWFLDGDTPAEVNDHLEAWNNIKPKFRVPTPRQLEEAGYGKLAEHMSDEQSQIGQRAVQMFQSGYAIPEVDATLLRRQEEPEIAYSPYIFGQDGVKIPLAVATDVEGKPVAPKMYNDEAAKNYVLEGMDFEQFKLKYAKLATFTKSEIEAMNPPSSTWFEPNDGSGDGEKS